LTPDPLIPSLLAAVSGTPDDVPLRLYLAQLLAAAQDREAAVGHATEVLAREPANVGALALLRHAGQAPTMRAA
jgi:thioredoxin-like negative regulator of GroEL